MEALLFNRRVTKFIKFSDKVDITVLRKSMRIENPLLEIIQKKLLSDAIINNFIFVWKQPRDTVSEEKSPLQSQNSSNLYGKELERVLVDIIEENTGQNEINKKF